MDIVHVLSPEHLAQFRELMYEYFGWVKTDLHIDLSYQGVQSELAALPGYYAPPKGRLLLALDGDNPAGCVALRPMQQNICELKRMYVRPAYRGQGLGRMLGNAVIEEAKLIGYQTIRLDTADSLTTARRLYSSLGFRERSAYYDVPADVLRWTVFMEMPVR
jgi:putative acetyltransferase